MSERIGTTVMIDRDILTKVKIIAIQRGISVSELIRQELKRIVEEEEERAKRGEHG